MSSYRVAANLEWTSKCNARCSMCPRDAIEHPQLMSLATLETALTRIRPEDVFRTVIAGYGEPTTHPSFFAFMERLQGHPVNFDMVTNGELLDIKKLKQIDGTLEMLVVSFSSIDPAVYRRVHVNLDHDTVMRNIEQANTLLTKTKLAISLTPLTECLETLPQTIEWFQARGINNLTMSPTLYNRAGTLSDHQQSTKRLRQIIADYNLHSQEFDFIPSTRDILSQCWHNRFRCVPRNSDIFITASGHYLYCYNDIAHKHKFGHVDNMSLRESLELREKMPPAPGLCDDCNMRERYGLGELFHVARNYLRQAG